MKKLIALLLAGVMLLPLASCDRKKGSEKKDSPIEVDKGLLTMEVTIGKNFFEDETPEEIMEDAKEEGYLDCTINEDGSVTYKMTKIQHKAKLKEFKEDLDETIAELLNGEDKVESFVSIDYNKDLTRFDIYVDSTKYSSWDSLYMLTFYLTGSYYQSFAGVDSDKIDVLVTMIDNETKEELSSGTYKQFLKNLEESQNETAEESAS